MSHGLAIDLETHDLYIRSGQMARVTEIDWIVQKITTLLLFFLGEWWLNRTAGFPWYQEIFVKTQDPAEADRKVKALILGVPGVKSILKYEGTFDAASRHNVITFEADTEFGETGEVSVSA